MRVKFDNGFTALMRQHEMWVIDVPSVNMTYYYFVDGDTITDVDGDKRAIIH